MWIPTPYWSHGPWAFLRDVSIVGTLAWTLYMLCYVNSGPLEGTPVDSNHKSLMLSSFVSMLAQFFCWTFNNWRANWDTAPPWYRSRWFFVTAAVVGSLGHVMTCAILLMACRRSPPRMEPSDPGYTVARAEAYHLWVASKVPLLAVLRATCGVSLALDCVTWVRWESGRIAEASEGGDVEMQDGGVVAVCGDRSGVPKEGEKDGQ